MMSLRIAAAVLIISAPLAGQAYAQSGSPGADWSKAETVEIDLDSYSFTPKALHLKRGMAYTLHFVNKSSKGHNFDAPKLFAALSVAPEDQSKVDNGKVEVGDGQSVDIKAVANTPGSYKFECSHFLHASFGMTGDAVIE